MALAPVVAPGPELTAEQVHRYSRHLLLDQLGREGQRRLLAARVLVLGAGGLGSPALLYLAAAGVGHLGIVDDDVVDPSNLQRQVIHTMADVGRPKVDSAAERVAALNPDVAVTRHRLRLDAANAHELLAGYDVVLDGTDNFPTRYLVSDVCAELGIPLVWASILRFDAQVAVFWSRPRAADDGDGDGDGDDEGDRGRNGDREPDAVPAAVTLRDLFPTPPPPGSTPSCGQAGVLGAMCGQVGAVMAAEAVKFITGTGDPLLGRVLVLDVLAARSRELPLRPRAGARPPRTPAELGYDPTGSPPGSVAARCAVPVGPSTGAGAGPAGGSGDAGAAEPVGMRTAGPAAAAAAGAAGTDDALPAVTASTLARRLTARTAGTDDFVLLDVREPAERTIVAIPGSVTIPLGEVLADPEAAVHRLGLDRPAGGPRDLLVHCRSGQRSAQAVRALAGAGAHAVNVTGGVLAWAADVDPTLPTY
ncbi:ThiF family adenylyltransferase [Georgenia sp. TF02-10]|uniref:ThiF family adenylyltransferase n=1 Tax=Georgenia sp. TF02-10 TaxID=2917725 RepID=UPI001FA742FE|nr:ThiF family adenylyltransferase [Georgenia sp. TF02-10]UNX55191.1 ThiF family adenylyltransferase [Georgenia sp. TF02-10]